MKKREISVHYHRTVSLGNYNSVKIGMGTTVELEEGEKKKEVMEREYDFIKDMVEELVTIEIAESEGG
jgi:hypothetical protein